MQETKEAMDAIANFDRGERAVRQLEIDLSKAADAQLEAIG